MKALPILAFLAAGCSLPTHLAQKTVELHLPAAVKAVACASHNGEITVVGDPDATEILLRAVIEIRAHSQAEANETLEQMSIVHEVTDGKLSIRGKHPEPLVGKIATFSFTLRVPPQVAVSLDSHNGTLTAKGIAGPLQLESHNGDIVVQTSGDRIRAMTHNGNVQVTANGAADLAGSLETHNGDATVDIGDGIATTIEATTNNGSIECADGFATTRSASSGMKCRIGDGKAVLAVATHNGDVHVRRAPKPTKN